ncbi:MAG: phosphoribosyltransferase [Xanthomonadales bacterium]|nr:phosphoribosyltransferase [Xanthomonadales bacterium]
MPTPIAQALPFSDRIDAAEQLARALSAHRGRHPLVMAIPRGAVPMARVIADRLDGQLDVVLVRKIGAPGNPEFAVGAIDESGWLYVTPHAGRVGADQDYLRRESSRQLALIRERRARYTPGRGPVDARGRDVIVVDDGMATGATMRAAIHALRRQDPAGLTCAVPVAAPLAMGAISPHVDSLVCLAAPEWFEGVGQFYLDFRQVEDSQVTAALSGSSRPAPDPPPSLDP